jgi:hypothetical protein
MTKILTMSESDIIRAMKIKKFSPLVFLAARTFNEKFENIDASEDGIIIWEDAFLSPTDYVVYDYLDKDYDAVRNFLETWDDYRDGIIDDFLLEPISFTVEKKLKQAT